MNYLAIEYTTKGATANSYKGYVRYPDDAPDNWHVPFLNYIKSEKNAISVSAYPLPRVTTPDNMGYDITWYTNLENEFYTVLSSTDYYPRNKATDAIRRSFSKLDLFGSQYNSRI